MTQPTIQPQTVTKPIQLLAAWLVGLVLVDGAFLGAATQLTEPDWAAGALTVAAIVNVPLFLAFLFLMQTRFRPEMQEDTFYARYLERKSAETQQIEMVRIDDTVARVPSPLPKPRFKRKSTGLKKGLVKINDLIPGFQTIVRELAASGVSFEDTFGSTSVGQTPPSPLLVSMGIDADVETFQEIARVMDRHGLEYVAISRGGIDEEYIHIGSYLFEGYGDRITPFKGDVKNSIMNEPHSMPSIKKLVPVIDILSGEPGED